MSIDFDYRSTHAKVVGFYFVHVATHRHDPSNNKKKFVDKYKT